VKLRILNGPYTQYLNSHIVETSLVTSKTLTPCFKMKRHDYNVVCTRAATTIKWLDSFREVLHISRSHEVVHLLTAAASLNLKWRPNKKRSLLSLVVMASAVGARSSSNRMAHRPFFTWPWQRYPIGCPEVGYGAGDLGHQAL